MFADLGIDVFNADHIARTLTEPGQIAYKKILGHFGSQILNQDETINRRLLRELIVANQAQRFMVRKLLHPLIRQQIKKNIEQATSPYCVVEIPLLVNKDLYPT